MWRECIKKIWEVDPLLCQHCGGLMKVVSFIYERKVIKKILDHLGLYEEDTSKRKSRCGAAVDQERGDPDMGIMGKRIKTCKIGLITVVAEHRKIKPIGPYLSIQIVTVNLLTAVKRPQLQVASPAFDRIQGGSTLGLGYQESILDFIGGDDLVATITDGEQVFEI